MGRQPTHEEAELPNDASRIFRVNFVCDSPRSESTRLAANGHMQKEKV